MERTSERDALTGAPRDDGPARRARIAVVIPCYNVAQEIMGVLERIGPECSRIYVVDDACPQRSGDRVEAQCSDPRVQVIRHAQDAAIGRR